MKDDKIHRLARVEISKLDLHKGNILVLHTPSECSEIQRDMLKDLLVKHMPKGVKLLIVPHGYSFSVLNDATTV